jgi:hypothetical protein
LRLFLTRERVGPNCGTGIESGVPGRFAGIQDLPNLRRETIRRKRLLQEFHAIFQDSVTNHRLIGAMRSLRSSTRGVIPKMWRMRSSTGIRQVPAVSAFAALGLSFRKHRDPPEILRKPLRDSSYIRKGLRRYRGEDRIKNFPTRHFGAQVYEKGFPINDLAAPGNST